MGRIVAKRTNSQDMYPFLLVQHTTQAQL